MNNEKSFSLCKLHNFVSRLSETWVDEKVSLFWQNIGLVLFLDFIRSIVITSASIRACQQYEDMSYAHFHYTTPLVTHEYRD